MQKNIILLIAVLFFAGFLSCHRKEKSSVVSGKSEEQKISVPQFNADSAYFYIAKQVSFGPRVPNYAAHRACGDYLVKQLRLYTPHITEQTGKVRAYDGTELSFRNIIASIDPENPNRILLASHWDSRPYADHDPDPANHRKPIDGANDGASGVGVLMEVARQLSMSQPRTGVDILLFDAEDYGPPQDDQRSGDNDAWGLGSQYWSRNPHIPGYQARYGILLDMVGVPNARFYKEGYSVYYAPDIVKKIWTIAEQTGFKDYFITDEGAFINDDHLYVNRIRRIPMIDIIHLDPNSTNGTFFDYWHTINDNMDHIDKYTLGVVGQTLLNVIFEEK